MQLSTTEKDDLLNGIRNAAVAVHSAKAAFRAGKTDEARKTLRAARDKLSDVLEDSYKKIVDGLDLEIDHEEFSHGGLYCTEESVSAEPATDAPAPEADVDGLLTDTDDEIEDDSKENGNGEG